MIEYPAAEDGQKQSKILPVIKQFDKAYEDQKLVVIYVYTDDLRKKMEAKRKLCESYMDKVLCKPKVAKELEGCIRLKINIDKLEDKKLSKAYKLSKTYPAIYMFDFQGAMIKSTTSRDEKAVITCLNYAEKKLEKLVKKLEKESEKD